ncbi:MAG: LuxR C-terminal-related transcriptional regulator [candidate division Zixibacteria bacterium]|nr:LuxR C-terminal-related transcriptional regulator [candidate division Zixibacteria bacterium]
MGLRESDFAEIMVDKLILESFANERSPYHVDEADKPSQANLDRFRHKLRWHIGHSLSKRQKQVIGRYLKGRTEREIAATLGITQQVVHIYKHRAIKKLRKVVAS